MTNVTNPGHYKGMMIKGVEVQPADVIEAYFLCDGLLSQACKYLLRAGRKGGSDNYTSDIGKSLWWIAKALLNRGAMIDLPAGTPFDRITIGGIPLEDFVG